jgi:TonB family protein
VPRGWATAFDQRLIGSFVVVGAIHALFVMYLRSMDVPLRLEPDVVPDRFADYIPDVEDPNRPLDLKELAKVGEEAEEKLEKPSEDRTRKAETRTYVCNAACQQAREALRRARLAKRVARMGVLKLLGTKGDGQGTAVNLIGGAGGETSADRAFAGVGGLTTSGRGAGGGLVAGDGTGTAVGIGDLGGKVGGPGRVGVGGQVHERVPRAVVKRAMPQITGSISADAVSRTIRRGMRSITSCYQRALRANPELAGKITVRIAINTMGRVVGVEVDEDTLGDPRVTSCIVRYIKRWRFPAPEQGDQGSVSVPFVFQSQAEGKS